jgi:hypothetical protein
MAATSIFGSFLRANGIGWRSGSGVHSIFGIQDNTWNTRNYMEENWTFTQQVPYYEDGAVKHVTLSAAQDEWHHVKLDFQIVGGALKYAASVDGEQAVCTEFPAGSDKAPVLPVQNLIFQSSRTGSFYLADIAIMKLDEFPAAGAQP